MRAGLGPGPGRRLGHGAEGGAQPLGAEAMLAGRAQAGWQSPSTVILEPTLELLRDSQSPRGALCGNRGCFRTMHGSVSAPSLLMDSCPQ